MRVGELHIYWGKADDQDKKDIVYHNGNGTSHCDSQLLYSLIGCKRKSTNYDAPLNSPRYLWTTEEDSLLEELEKRGYDLTTLRFSIRKKA